MYLPYYQMFSCEKIFFQKKELIVDNLKMANNMNSLFAWVIENLQESNNSGYLDLIEIKKYEIELQALQLEM